MAKILGLESVYKEALDRKDCGMSMPISAEMVCEMVERLGELEGAVIDLRASLRTCQNTSNAIMDQYKDL
jgi:hypothetical protein